MEKTRLTISLLLLCSLIAGCTNSQMAPECAGNPCSDADQKFRFIVAADPQLFRGQKEDFDRAIQLINQQAPEFVVVCGDMVETSGNLQQIQAYKDSVSALSPEISLYSLPGNHDLGLPVKQEKLDIYRRHFGPLWFDFTYRDSLFIALCSNILADPNAPTHKEQIEWLTGVLQRPQSRAAKSIFVFMHYPLFLDAFDEPDGYSNMPTALRQELLDLFAAHRVRAVFSGHLHNKKINHYKGMDLITVNSVAVPAGQAAPGFCIVDVSEHGYEYNFCPVALSEKDSYEKANLP